MLVCKLLVCCGVVGVGCCVFGVGCCFVLLVRCVLNDVLVCVVVMCCMVLH